MRQFSDVAAFIKAAAKWLLDIELSDGEADLIAAIIVVASLLVTFGLVAWRVVLWVRRRLGDDEAISDDQAAMVRLIKNDLASMRQTIDKFGEQLGSTIGGQLDAIGETIRATAAQGNDNQQPEADEKKGVRLFYAERVRDAVMHKFMSGGWFAETVHERHVFSFVGVSASGAPIHVSVATPYRKAVADDGRGDYVLEVFSARKKLLVFEWDYEGGDDPKVGYLARDRKWVEEIVAWEFAAPAATPARLEAAE